MYLFMAEICSVYNVAETSHHLAETSDAVHDKRNAVNCIKLLNLKPCKKNSAGPEYLEKNIRCEKL